MQIPTFAEIADEFISTVHSQVWCNAATTDAKGRPRSRVLHPIWENSATSTTGWIITGRQTLKASHLNHSPYMSLSYMKDPLKPVYVDCQAAWIDEQHEKQRIWNLFNVTPPPLGYDPGGFFGTIENPAVGLLKLIPWRIELADLFGQTRVWKAV